MMSICQSLNVFRLLSATGLLLMSVLATAQNLPAGASASKPVAATPSSQTEGATTTLQLLHEQPGTWIKQIENLSGKPVKNEIGHTQLSASKSGTITPGQAVELIHDALLMKGFCLVELKDQIRIVEADVVKDIQIPMVDEKADLQSMADSNRMMRKAYQPRNISAANLHRQLLKFVPGALMTLDEKNNTLTLTDLVTRLKREDRVIRTLDRTEGDRVVEFFPLFRPDTMDAAGLVTAFLEQSVARDITVIPDSRHDQIVVDCPRGKLADVSGVLRKLDPEPQPVKDNKPAMVRAGGPAPAPPAAKSGGGGRKEFSYGASKVVFDGGKFYLNGMEVITLTPDRMNKMSDEDIRKMAEQIVEPEKVPAN